MSISVAGDISVDVLIGAIWKGQGGRPLGGDRDEFWGVDATGLGRKRSNRGHQQGASIAGLVGT
jgi:hypothetical protein